MNDPKVAIVIINWNGLADTIECLSSLQKIDYENYKVIVLDNGSRENETEVLKKKFGEWLAIFRSDVNLGFAGGNNLAIDQARSLWAPEYYLLLNNDVVVDPHFLAPLVEALEEGNRVGIAGPMVLSYYNKNKVVSAGHKMTRLTRITVQNSNEIRLNLSRKEVDYVSGCALLIKSKVIDEIGQLDPNYFLYVEEKDWCMRARLQGYSCLYVPDGQVWHKGSVSTEKTTALIDYYMLRGQILFLKKFYNGFWCCIGVFSLFGFQLVIAAKKSIKNRDSIFLKACLKGLSDGLLNNYIYRWPQGPERGSR